MKIPHLARLHACQAAALLARREIKAQDLVRAYLDRISEREPKVHAFTQINPDAALAQARTLDAGPLRGLLHGLPLGVKDLIDSVDFPTSYGSPIYANHQPAADAAVLALCKEQGAVLLGKTVSTELAYFSPGPTCNPHNLKHTPGGSSSGSVAAVADHMLALALGTQTAGSIIRPAAFCGVVGYKPSLGRVTSAGVKSLSPSLDVVGGFGRSVCDVGLLGAALSGDLRLANLGEGAAVRIGLCPTPHWDQVDHDTRQAWAQAVAALAPQAAHCVEVVMPQGFESLLQLQKDVMAFEMARALSHERLAHSERMSERLRDLMNEGMAISGEIQANNLNTTAQWRLKIDALFERHDVLLTPSAIGEAPAGTSATGDPMFCRSWSLLGLPSVHLPFFTGSHGLPIGLQLVGRFGQDHQLLAAAHWVHQRLTR